MRRPLETLWPSLETAHFVLPVEFERKLDFPGVRGRSIDQARTGNRSTGLIEERTVVDRRSEVWMIEYVEEFRAELQIEALLEVIILDERKVEVLKSGADHFVSASIPEKVLTAAHLCRKWSAFRSDRRCRDRKSKATGVDVVGYAARVREGAPWYTIRHIVRRRASFSEGVSPDEWREGRTSRDGEDATYLPTLGRPAQGTLELFRAWNIPNEIDAQALRNVEITRTTSQEPIVGG